MSHPTPEMLELEDRSAALRLAVRQAGQRLRHEISGAAAPAGNRQGLLESGLSFLKLLPGNRSISALSMVMASAWITARLNKTTKPQADHEKGRTSAANTGAKRSPITGGYGRATIVGLIGISAGGALARLLPVSSLERSILAEHKPQLVALAEGIADQSLTSAKQSLVEAFGLSKLIATVLVLFGTAAAFRRE